MLLLPKKAKILGQGITGSEGSAALPRMLEYGTKIVAGVTPGKGGQVLNNVPIFNTVKEAIDSVGMVDGVVQFVPPKFALSAAQEAMEAGIKFIVIGAEKVPTKDGAIIYALSQKYQANVIGPNSVGIICPSRQIRIGLIGGSFPDRMFTSGSVAVISKSGSMTAEIGLHLKNHGLGVSWAVGIGGDRIIGTDFADFLLELEKDQQTKVSVIFGELGGTYEERVAKLVSEGAVNKPVVAFIGGEFTQKLPLDVQFGHAGAIIEGNRGLPDHKRKILTAAGVKVAENFDQIATFVKQVS